MKKHHLILLCLYAAGLPAMAAPAPASSLPELQRIHNKISGAKFKSSDSRWSQKRILQLLPRILNGEDVNVSLDGMKGNTCLHYACELGSRDLIRWLVENGADVNRVEWGGGNTPLHCSARLASLYSVNYLLEHGANPDIANNEGLKPVDMVGNDDHDAICAALCTAGANVVQQQGGRNDIGAPIPANTTQSNQNWERAISPLGNLPDAATAKKAFDIQRDQYRHSSNRDDEGYTYGDPIEESRGMYQAFSKNTGDSEIIYRLSFPTENSTSQLLVVNDEILVTLSSTGSVDIWDSRTLTSIVSVWTDICAMHSNPMNADSIWYGYDSHNRNLRLFYISWYVRATDHAFGDFRLFVDLNDKIIDSVNVMYPTDNPSLAWDLTEGDAMPVARPVFKLPAGRINYDATIHVDMRTPLSYLSRFAESDIVHDYAFDFWEGKCFDWSRVDARALSVNAEATAVAELPPPGVTDAGLAAGRSPV